MVSSSPAKFKANSLMRDLIDNHDLDDVFAENDAFDDYQERAAEYAFYSGMLLYPALGLASEAGEVADKVKKLIRDDDMPISEEFHTTDIAYERREELAYELSDCLWYIALIADDIGFSLSDIATMNLEKLESRRKRGKLHGSGDFR